MASIRDLKRQITSTKSTMQTTKALKMVSAAKLRRAQDAITAQRPYAKGVASLIKFLASMPELPLDSPLISRASSSKKLLILLVTSDRGLAGGFNSNVSKATQRWIKANSANYDSIKIGFLGKKAYDFWKIRSKDLAANHADLTGKVTFAKAKELSKRLTESYLSGEFDEIKIVYNEFKNAVSQTVQVEDFLPLGNLAEAGIGGDSLSGSAADKAARAGTYLVKPNPKALMESLLSKHFSIQCLRIMLESQASEHGARMSAMENATNNAEEMVRLLTLQYNKQRQAGITKELLEIIAGSESAKAS